MHVFFDVDGVLIDGYSNNPKLHRPWHGSLEKDLNIDPVDMQRHLFTPRFFDVAVGKRDLHEAVGEFLQAVSSTVSAQELIDYWFKKDSVLNDALWHWLDEKSRLPKEKLFIATNQEKNRASYLWNDLAFKNRFSDIFYSGDLGVSKSDQAFFETVRQRTGLNPQECLLVDDTQKVIDTAKVCGWRTVLYEGPESLESLDRILAS